MSQMKKYLSFFRMRFLMGLQYRAAAAAGVVTQFTWGFMELLVFRAFYQADASAFPMSFEAVASYIWLQQAFLALFMAWMMEAEIFSSIVDGNIAYEMCRPIHIYSMWFARSVANRVSKAFGHGAGFTVGLVFLNFIFIVELYFYKTIHFYLSAFLLSQTNLSPHSL